MRARGEGGRWHAIDHVKAAAIVAVVFTHAGRVGMGERSLSVDFLLSGLWTPFQVPSFLFASGFLYASRAPLSLASVGRRLQRVLLPYLVASLCAILVGLALGAALPGWTRWPAPVRSVSEAAWQLATASALGVYYYIFLFACCIPLTWPLSRSGLWAAWLLCGAMAVLGVAIDLQILRPAWVLADHFGGGVLFWALRDPFARFQLGYFLAGWLAALQLARLADFASRRRRLAVALCAAGAVFGWAGFSGLLVLPSYTVVRVVYSLSVVGLLAIATHRRVAGPVVRFLGDGSLGIYLIHRMFQLLAEPISTDWPAAARVAAQVVFGLGGACLVLGAGRLWLGEERARRWLGA